MNSSGFFICSRLVTWLNWVSFRIVTFGFLMRREMDDGRGQLAAELWRLGNGSGSARHEMNDAGAL